MKWCKYIIRLIAMRLVYPIVDAIARCRTPAKSNNPSIIVLRVDLFGDYLVFRNLLNALRHSEPYQNYSITLLGNEAWQDLSEYLDSHVVDAFIWLNRQKFMRNPIYRFKIIRQLTAKQYDICLSSVFSRHAVFPDYIVKLLHATEKIGSAGDCANINPQTKRKTDTHYTQLVPVKQGLQFEFYRNRAFFEAFLGRRLAIKKPRISLKQIAPVSLPWALPTPYAVIFIGASGQYKKWTIKGFAEVASYIKQHYGFNIVLCGGPDEVEDAHAFTLLFPYEVNNLVGKTSYVELLAVLAGCQLLVSNDTSAPHAAIALGVEPVVVISPGLHFYRWVPYPAAITQRYAAVFPPAIQAHLDKDNAGGQAGFQSACETYGYGRYLDIDTISAQAVIAAVNEQLQ